MKIAEPEKLNNLKNELDIRTLERLKTAHDKSMAENQVEVYVKGKTSQPVVDTIEEEKNSKNPIEVKVSGRHLKLYLHPVSGDMESADSMIDMSRITSWGMCTIPDEIKTEKN